MNYIQGCSIRIDKPKIFIEAAKYSRSFAAPGVICMEVPRFRSTSTCFDYSDEARRLEDLGITHPTEQDRRDLRAADTYTGQFWSYTDRTWSDVVLKLRFSFTGRRALKRNDPMTLVAQEGTLPSIASVPLSEDLVLRLCSAQYDLDMPILYVSEGVYAELSRLEDYEPAFDQLMDWRECGFEIGGPNPGRG